MNNFIKSDLYRYGGLTGYKGILKAYFIPGFRFMFHHRIFNSASKYSLRWFINRLWLFHYTFKYGFQIPTTTKIGHGFYIGHFGTIIINPKAIIGNNCNITSGVTIGQTNRGLLKGVPIIGDQVWIGSNCTIVGGIVIGNNVLIAPNSYVNINVPSNSIVIGNPAKVIPKLNAVESYIDFIFFNQ
jgi:serine O-acetyltransferase